MDDIDVIIVKFIYRIFNKNSPVYDDGKAFLIIQYEKFISDTRLNISPNELFARLQDMVELGILKQKIISTKTESGETIKYLGYRKGV